jgi:hypothetical protein
MSEANKPLLYFVILALSAIAHCLWMRRFAWTCHYDRAATLSVAIQGVAILLMTPLIGVHIGVVLRWLIGLWHLHYLLAHLAFLAAGVCTVYHYLTRLGDDQSARDVFRVHVELPLTVAVPAMLVTFSLSKVNHQPADFILSPPDLWLKAYWIIGCSMGLWLITSALQCLLILRRARRHRLVADIYILACVAGLVVLTTQLSTAFIGGLRGSMAPLLAGCITATMFACGVTYSWYRRSRPWM